MTKPIQLPPDEVMREMSKVALEAATQSIATHARQFALQSADLNGQDALNAFADAILSTNAKVFKPSEKKQ